jgi:uncharacterized protein (TIGR02453 family)
MRSGFPGFSPEAMTFFRGLARNNRREWFLPRKPIFEEHLKRPMEQLVEALGAGMMQFAPSYVTEPEKAIYRFYRDTRFSKDKTPYKDHIAASFPRRGFPKHHGAGFYFSVSAKSVEVGGGVYLPPPESLSAIRQHMAQYHEEFRAICRARNVRTLLGELQGEQLARVPKGFCAEDPAADLVRYKQYLLFTELDGGIATTPKLFTEIEKRFRAMTPFIEFLNAPLVRKERGTGSIRPAWH